MTFNFELLKFRRDTLPLIEQAERMLPIAAEHGIDLAPRVQWARERCDEIERDFQAYIRETEILAAG